MHYINEKQLKKNLTKEEFIFKNHMKSKLYQTDGYIKENEDIYDIKVDNKIQFDRLKEGLQYYGIYDNIPGLLYFPGVDNEYRIDFNDLHIDYETFDRILSYAGVTITKVELHNPIKITLPFGFNPYQE